ncbi:polyprenyl synthetase family protein [Marinilactibacillus psychrotolerans]|uniref:Geranylgeranyl pyrophosphate synthase n=1 Tax=Marinilactibacillus psychrotolerans TaxID=191770 RepID=A0AAV3WTR7_9LACT|nr:polyprenyl synthetase family protein [Marinilactibacillus psychrotolerans]GEL66549.1 geranylgeranyl pyrophosphate synthase [Marinilactibacillus psychrotolerans]GEQ35071.1 geranylgeranyl pyrophosphate synthase [Marinilactibacillus psychrotolerans]SDD21169.1 heptaprenyl diphosphate synthase [Marinilactibacillus psychrotolerans]
MSIHSIWDEFPDLEKELKQTRQLIFSKIFIRNQQVNDAAKGIFQSSGKMIRPAYSLLFSQLGPKSEPERARVMAAAIEVFHNATLIHDDIIDEGDIRRGTPTIQAAHGKKSAVYAGDYLLSVCFRMTHPYRQIIDVQGILTRAMERVIGGELHQLDQSYNQEMTIRRYLTQIRGKTAELYALACFGGAMESNMSTKDQWLSYRIGVQIGMAFQLMDDLLEYTQDDAVWEKTMFQDLKNGIYTAPILFSMKRSPVFFKKQFAKTEYTEQDFIEIRKELMNTQGIREAFQLAERYTNKALKLIDQLPDGKSKEDIKELTEILLYREL